MRIPGRDSTLRSDKRAIEGQKGQKVRARAHTTSYFYDFEAEWIPIWNERGYDNWYYFDYEGQDSGGIVVWSGDVAHSGIHSAMMRTTLDRHRLTVGPKYEFEDFTKTVLEFWFYTPDITRFSVIEFGPDKFTGFRRISAGVQYLCPKTEGGQLNDGTEPRWRYWSGGPFGDKMAGEWLEFEGNSGEQQIASNAWHYVKLITRHPSAPQTNQTDDSMLVGRYVSLQVDQKFVDLSKYKITPLPQEKRSSTWMTRKAFGISISSRLGGPATLYFDDVSVIYTIGDYARA